jgi:molybdopterin-guanine dinucleotide biosynthesis protein
MSWKREDELNSTLEAIDDGIQTIHISGQPGVGKSTFLESLADELSASYKTRTLYIREGNSPTTVTQDLLHEVRDAVGPIRALLNKATGASVGMTPVSGGVSTDDRARHLQKLADISESVKSENPLILFIDDVHKLDDPAITRGYLRELNSNLGGNVHLITAGRLTYEDAGLNIHLKTFTREETAEYLRQKYPDVKSETIDDIYEKLDGHPYYLGLLTEATDSDTTFEIPEEEARDFIERAYLDSMSQEEEEFIRKTSGLAELDEEICSAVLDDISRTQARRLLTSLSSKAVVTELGRSEDTGNRVFKVHDLFQEFLYQQHSNPDDLHREAFQYYAGKLYDAAEESGTPPLEGFVFGLMGNAHLNAIYGGEPEVQQLRAEVDRLGLEPQERLQFIFGYAPYVPVPDECSPKLLALELDEYTSWLRNLAYEDEKEELQIEIYSVMMDLLRATQRSNAEVEFEQSGLEIHESTIQRINEVDFVAFFDEDEQDAAQILPDLLRLCTHVAAHQDAKGSENQKKHLTAAYDVLEKYGSDRVAVEGFLNNCHELAEEYEAGEQAEEMVEGQMEEYFDQFDQDDVTRNTLIRMQSDLYGEMMGLANSAFTAMISESDRLLEFVHDCGNSLENADNPFFVAAWYSFAAHMYRMFAPKAESTKELEEAAQHYAKLRMEYEDDLDNVIYEIDEFEIHDVEVPDLVNEITEGDNESQLIE